MATAYENVVQEAVIVGSEAGAHGGSHFEVVNAGVGWKPCLPEHKIKVCELSTGTIDRGGGGAFICAGKLLRRGTKGLQRQWVSGWHAYTDKVGRGFGITHQNLTCERRDKDSVQGLDSAK